MLLTKGSIVAGSSKIWAGLNSVTELAKRSDVPAAYVHPSTKVCTGGDAGTLNGKTASQIISEAASSSKVITLYDTTLDASGWTSSITTVRVYAYKFSSSDIYKYISFGVYVKAIIHYRTTSDYSSDRHQFTISLAQSGDHADWNTEIPILSQYPKLPNADNTSSAEFNFYGPLTRYDNGYCIDTSSKTFAQIAISGYTSSGLASGANLSGSSVYVKIQAIRA